MESNFFKSQIKLINKKLQFEEIKHNSIHNISHHKRYNYYNERNRGEKSVYYKNLITKHHPEYILSFFGP